jgi:hypothetical protein
MKKLFAIVVTTLISSAAFAQSYTAPVVTHIAPGPPKPAPPLPAIAPSGVVPRALSGGNPLQMLNPAAPARTERRSRVWRSSRKNQGKERQAGRPGEMERY